MKTALLFLLAAGGAFQEGTWKIESATVAPWWKGSEAPKSGFVKDLVGRSFSIKDGHVEGPGILACTSGRMAVKDVPAQGLFQGMLGEDEAKANRAAAGLGFQRGPWKTVDGGCDLEFHFSDTKSGAFGLDNYVFRFRKVRP